MRVFILTLSPYWVCRVRGDFGIIRAFIPGAQTVVLTDILQPLRRVAQTDLFEWRGSVAILPQYYRLT